MGFLGREDKRTDAWSDDDVKEYEEKMSLVFRSGVLGFILLSAVTCAITEPKTFHTILWAVGILPK